MHDDHKDAISLIAGSFKHSLRSEKQLERASSPATGERHLLTQERPQDGGLEEAAPADWACSTMP
jgi:hypothetical protein